MNDRLKTLCIQLWGALLLTLFTGCGVPSGQFRIRGEYKHLEGADFLIYNTEGLLGTIDTLHVLHGEFEYVGELKGEGTFHILYPNGDKLILWAHSGDDITLEGDAQNLLKVRVGGNEENELYTDFRQQLEGTDTATIRRAAAAFIRLHPQSDVSAYLLQRHFLYGYPAVSQDSIQRLYKVLHDARPQDATVTRLGGSIRQRYAMQQGTPMPDFQLQTTDSVVHRLADYRGRYLLLYFWAGWMGTPSAAHTLLADSLQSDTTLHAISYSMDVDSLTFSVTRYGKMLEVPTYCDYQAFQGTLPKALGLTELPYAVLVDCKGRIRASGKEIRDVLRQTR